MLFHEIYGSYYLAVASILKEAAHGKLTGSRMNSLIREHAFGESLLTIPDGLKGEKWKLMHKDFSTPLKEEPSMPLSILEKRWMKALLLDPRILLFHPDMSGLEEVEPLFTPKMLVYYDRYTDGDNYQDLDYKRHFDTILKALQHKRNLYIRFESRQHVIARVVVTPYYLEYSEKDDRFRLVAAGSKGCWTINLSRVIECRFSDRSCPMPLKESVKRSVILELEDRRNTLNRVLLHFSHLEKETKKLDEHSYRLTLKYDRQDETEMVIRILSFGPTVKVVEPQQFICLLRERIDRQRQLLTAQSLTVDPE